MNIEHTKKLLSGEIGNVFDLIDYSDLCKKYCCYCICDTVTGIVYIGKATDFKSRMVGHRAKLRSGTHTATEIQRGYSMGHKIVYFVIERFDEDILSNAAEAYWIKAFGDRCCNKYKPKFTATSSGRDEVFLDTVSRFGFYFRGGMIMSHFWEYKKKKTDSVLELLKEGVPKCEISDHLGIPKNNLSTIISYLKKKGRYNQ